MEPQPAESFFEITISHEGAQRVLRLYKTVKWLLAVCLLLSTFWIGSMILRIVVAAKFQWSNNFLGKIETVVVPIYSGLATVFLIAQWYSFFHFSRLCKKSIELRQSDLFNYSFKWLQRCAVIAIVLMLIELLFTIFVLGEYIYLLRTFPAS